MQQAFFLSQKDMNRTSLISILGLCDLKWAQVLHEWAWDYMSLSE